MAVLRNMAHVTAPTGNGCLRDILLTEGDLALGGLFQTGQTVDKLTLTISVNTGDTDDLSGPHVKADAVHGILLAALGGNGQILYTEHDLTGFGGLLAHFQLNGTAHHHVGQGLLVRILSLHSTDILTLTQNGHAVGYRHDLIQLMGDEQNGFAFTGKLLHGCHQLVDLLRSQNGGRLVKNQDLIVTVEHLQDLHTLLHTNGDVLDPGIQIHLQTITLRNGLHLLARFLLGQDTHLGGLRTQDDVVQNRKYVDQLEMLMDHADAQGRGVIGVIDLDDLAVFLDHTCFRLIQAEQNAHQRGFSRTVFAQQRMDLATAQLKRNVVICNDTRKFLGNIQHLDYMLRLHKDQPASYSKIQHLLYSKRHQKTSCFHAALHIRTKNKAGPFSPALSACKSISLQRTD